MRFCSQHTTPCFFVKRLSCNFSLSSGRINRFVFRKHHNKWYGDETYDSAETVGCRKPYMISNHSDDDDDR